MVGTNEQKIKIHFFKYYIHYLVCLHKYINSLVLTLDNT